MRTTVWFTTIATLATACAGGNADEANNGFAPDTVASAEPVSPASLQVTALMHDSAGNELGTLTLLDGTGGIMVTGTLRGVSSGSHAIHLHMIGSCEPPFASAGGHWNPTNRQHGQMNPNGPHLGDLPNISVNADGTVDVNVTTAGGELTGGNALLDSDGAAIVIHQMEDDYRSDPAGNSGDRIACGVVQAR